MTFIWSKLRYTKLKPTGVKLITSWPSLVKLFSNKYLPLIMGGTKRQFNELYNKFSARFKQPLLNVLKVIKPGFTDDWLYPIQEIRFSNAGSAIDRDDFTSSISANLCGTLLLC